MVIDLRVFFIAVQRRSEVRKNPRIQISLYVGELFLNISNLIDMARVYRRQFLIDKYLTCYYDSPARSIVKLGVYRRITMRERKLIVASFLLFMCLPFLNAAAAETKMPGSISLELKGAKQKPVSFSHETHVQKQQIDCALCHHRDKNPKQPQACTSCHPINQGKSGAPQAQGAFHKQCTTCHKESTARNLPAPTKCSECHKS